MLKERGRLSVQDGLLDVARFCVCNLGSSLGGGMNASFVVVIDASATAVERQKSLCGSCLIRVTSMNNTKSIRMFEDDVT
jgi:hypothetical protein